MERQRNTILVCSRSVFSSALTFDMTLLNDDLLRMYVSLLWKWSILVRYISCGRLSIFVRLHLCYGKLSIFVQYIRYGKLYILVQYVSFGKLFNFVHLHPCYGTLSIFVQYMSCGKV